MIRDIFTAFIPLFVAVDAIGVLPIYASLTAGMNKKAKNKVIYQSLITAVCLAIGFIFLGNAVFRFLNITIGDFMVAGGTLLFCMALVDLVNPTKSRRRPQEMGIVPLGTPLITGPAVLTTSLIVMGEYGLAPTLISVLSNIIIAGIIFIASEGILKLIGTAGSRALSKITSLLLAAIAVMMIRKGVFYIIRL